MRIRMPERRNDPLEWVGPFSVRDLLLHSNDSALPVPPEAGSAYLVSKRRWSGAPTAHCKPLYVGGNTGRGARFRTRIGDLIADMFGFFGSETGHHSGGQTLHRWCKKNGVNPLKLHLAWVARCDCHRCLEVDLVRDLAPLLNRKAPARCSRHS